MGINGVRLITVWMPLLTFSQQCNIDALNAIMACHDVQWYRPATESALPCTEVHSCCSVVRRFYDCHCLLRDLTSAPQHLSITTKIRSPVASVISCFVVTLSTMDIQQCVLKWL